MSFHAAGAAVVLVVGPDESAIRLRQDGREIERDAAIEMAITVSAQMEGSPPQVVLVEGFQHTMHPVILVGTLKRSVQAETVLMTLPEVPAINPQELEQSLDRLTDLVIERMH